jgi:hypothetical protein
MTLYDIIADLDSHSEDDIIYAAPINGKWCAESPAALVPFPEDGDHLRSMGQDRDGMTYMLEVFLANEVIDDWAARTGVEYLDIETKIKLLAYYAEHDAYPRLDAIAV